MTLQDPTTPDAKRKAWSALDEDCREFVRWMAERFSIDEVQAWDNGRLTARWKRRV